MTGCTASSEAWHVAQSDKRIADIMDLNILTREEIQKAVDEAYVEYGRGLDPEVWDVFLHGPADKYEKLHTNQCHGPQNWVAHPLWFVRF